MAYESAKVAVNMMATLADSVTHVPAQDRTHVVARSVTVRQATREQISVQVPIAIIGAGACGVLAALAAARAGVPALVLERDALPGGSTALSSGFVPAAGTHAQHRAGLVDSIDGFAQDIQRKAKSSADPLLVKALTEAIGPIIDWLEEQHKIPFEVLREFLYPGHSVARMHCVLERTGEGLLAQLWARAETLAVTLMTQARVDTLLRDQHGRIVGLEYQRPNGQRETIGCEQLILACNGFGGNPVLVERFIPQMTKAIYFGHAGNTGDAIEWGEAIGATVADTGAYQGHGSVAQPHGLLITWGLMVAGGIQVNSAGLRFWDESQGYSEAALAVLAQADGMAWNVYDQRVHQMALSFPDYQQAWRLGAVKQAADVVALARVMAVDPQNLNRELTAIEYAAANGEVKGEVNGEVNRKSADRFGRRFESAQRLQAPWFAIKVTGALFHTQGGLAVDAQMRVRRNDGSVFDNLRAAGGAARGVSGDAVSGYLSGNGLLSAVAGGYLAGAAAARDCRVNADVE